MNNNIIIIQQQNDISDKGTESNMTAVSFPSTKPALTSDTETGSSTSPGTPAPKSSWFLPVMLVGQALIILVCYRKHVCHIIHLDIGTCIDIVVLKEFFENYLIILKGKLMRDVILEKFMKSCRYPVE